MRRGTRVSDFPNHILKRDKGFFPLVVLLVFTPSLPSHSPKTQHPRSTLCATGNYFKISGQASCESVYSIDRLQCYTAVQVSQPHTETEAGL